MPFHPRTIDPSVQYRKIPVYTVPVPVKTCSSDSQTTQFQVTAILDAMTRRILVGMGVL